MLQCSVTCGRGKQMRKVHCVQYDVAMDQLLRKNEDACSFREPNAVKKCSAGPCPTRAPRPKRYYTCGNVYSVVLRRSEMFITSNYRYCITIRR